MYNRRFAIRPLILLLCLCAATRATAAPSDPPTNVNTILFRNGDLFYYTDTDTGDLWRSDGTIAGSVRLHQSLREIELATTRTGDPIVWFVAGDDAGVEVWHTDGTPNGTARLRDLNPGDMSAWPKDLTRLGERIIFSADDGVHGRELWASDGTSDGTVLLADALPGPASGNPGSLGSGGELVRSGDLIYFTAGDTRSASSPGTYYVNLQLWRTDGTPAGTWVVKDRVRPFTSSALYPQLGPIPGPSPTFITTIRTLIPYQGQLLFTVEREEHANELWRTDGTPGGTRLLQRNTAGCEGLSATFSTVVNGTLVFCAYATSVIDFQLWRSDGTSEGTFPLAASGGVVIYPISDQEAWVGLSLGGPPGLWRTDGTRAGTRRIVAHGIINGALPLFRSDSFLQGGRLFYVTTTFYRSHTLWVSDGTRDGSYPIYTWPYSDPTPQMITIPPQPTSSQLLYLVVSDSDFHNTLWVSDGTPLGTRPIGDLGRSAGPHTIVPRASSYLINVVSALGETTMIPFPNAPSGFVRMPAVASAPPDGLAGIPIRYGTNGTGATGVSVSVTLPAGLTYVDDTAGVAPAVSGSTLTWSLPNLATLESREIWLRVHVPAGPLGTRFPLSASVNTSEPPVDLSQVSASPEVLRADLVFMPAVSSP